MKIIVPIVEFYDIIFKNYISNEILKNFNEKESILFKEIKKGNITTDKQAATLLYDGNPSGQAYSKMKQGILDKLIKIVISYEAKNSSKNKKKVISLYNDYHAFLILSANNLNKAKLAFGKKIVLQAERLEQFEIGALVSRIITFHCQTYLQDSKQGDKYWGKYTSMKQSYENIGIIQKEYSDLMLLTKKKHYNEELSEKSFKALEKIRDLVDPNNFRTKQFFYQIRYLAHAAISEHHGVIENNLEAIEYFRNHRIVNKSIIDTLTVQLIISYLGTGQYEKAAEFLSVEAIEATDYRWFNKVALKIRIYFSLQKYEEANELMDMLFNSVRFKQTELPFQEQMWLYKYYNDIMLYFNHGVKVNTRRIRNNLTRISIDKSGYNIPFLLAEIIYMIQKKGITAIYSEEDALKTYVKTHLKNSNNERSIIFIRFLLALPNSKFDYKKFEEQYKASKESFREYPAAITTKPDNEIIPYEDLMHTLVKHYVSKELVEEKVTQSSSAQQGQAASDY